MDELMLKSQPIIYVSISSNTNSFRSMVYPNPVLTQLNVDFQLENSGNIEMGIYDLAGKLILSDNFLGITGKNYRKVNTQDLSKGIYVLKIVSEKEEISVTKFIVK
jgi:hypothetical protein